jgi:tetratricopeptide (TPR) repeat protein
MAALSSGMWWRAGSVVTLAMICGNCSSQVDPTSPVRQSAADRADRPAGVALTGAGQPAERSLRSPSASAAKAASGPRPFVDVTSAAGIHFVHQKPMLDNKLDPIMPWMASVGASAAAMDYDGDGDIDLYLTNSESKSRNALYRNEGDGTFVEVAGQLGVDRANETPGGSMDAVWGDYDNDGDLDLYVVKWGWNVLYRNDGHGKYTDVTDQAGVGDQGNGNAAVWLDYNDDNYLDLYVCNYFRYVNLWNLQDSRQMHEDFETARDGGANVLYHNNGDGTFREVAAELGVDDTGWSLDAGCGDYDNDGDQDLVVANDFGQDRVFRRNADGTFTNVTDEVIGWDTNKGMNVDFGDYNNDGWPDLYITNIWTKEYVQEGNQLYRNMGNGTFSDVSFETKVYDAGWAWAGRFWDYDNDGDLDLIVANGYISGNRDKEYFQQLAVTVTKPGFDPVDARNWPPIGDSTFAGYEPKRVWRNEGNETFTEVAAELGLDDIRDGRGLAIADFDNDGDLDVYLSNQGQPGVLYRNEIGNRNNWLEIDLAGANCNRFAVGARVTLVSEGLSQIREVDGGNGDHSQCPYRLHFGLGQRKTIERLEVRWPHGYVQTLRGVSPNQVLRLQEETPESHWAERARWKETQLAAWQQAREQARAATETAAKAAANDAAPEWAATLQFKRDFVRCKSAVERAPDDPQKRYEFALLLDKLNRQPAALSELEKAVEMAPERMLYFNAYRMFVRRYGHLYYDRSIRFCEDQYAAHPDSLMVRLNLALAYVDKMPYPKLGIVGQGILSNKSLQLLDGILRQHPGCWTAKFVRGMNHLHWPRMLGHAPQAIADFSELIAMQKTLPADQQHDYFALAYVALGDAYVKNCHLGRESHLAKAREAWEQGLREYPDCAELRERLQVLDASADDLIRFVNQLRGLESPVDTDLSRVWFEREQA